MTVTKNKVLPPAKMWTEQAFMLRLRFSIALYNSYPNPKTEARIKATFNAFESHLKTVSPSPWFRQNFIVLHSYFAGLVWACAELENGYMVTIQDQTEQAQGV